MQRIQYDKYAWQKRCVAKQKISYPKYKLSLIQILGKKSAGEMNTVVRSHRNGIISMIPECKPSRHP